MGILEAIATIIGGLGTLMAGIEWIVKTVRQTPEQMKEGVDQSVQQRQSQAEESGRPQ